MLGPSSTFSCFHIGVITAYGGGAGCKAVNGVKVSLGVLGRLRASILTLGVKWHYGSVGAWILYIPRSGWHLGVVVIWRSSSSATPLNHSLLWLVLARPYRRRNRTSSCQCHLHGLLIIRCFLFVNKFPVFCEWIVNLIVLARKINCLLSKSVFNRDEETVLCAKADRRMSLYI